MILACAFLAIALLTIGSSPLRRIHNPESANSPRAGPGAGERLMARVRKLLPHKHTVNMMEVAADVDLFAACLHAGLSNQAAATAVAHVARSTKQYWAEVSSLLAVGASTSRAWQGMEELDGLGELARLAIRSEHSGAAIARGCARLSTNLRDDAQAHAVARAERAGVLISLPLTVCFLPAFIVLGLVPIVISLGSQML